jgi:hypothetical protein
MFTTTSACATRPRLLHRMDTKPDPERWYVNSVRYEIILDSDYNSPRHRLCQETDLRDFVGFCGAPRRVSPSAGGN